MKKVFVSGGSGYIALHCIAKLIQKGYSVRTSIRSLNRKQEIIDGYFKNLEPVFARLADFEEGDLIDEYLESKVCRTGFQRLN